MAALVLIALLATPEWYFEPPWPGSPERILWALEEASEDGHCVEVCWFLDGRVQGCTPMIRTEDGMVECYKEKLARTEGFEMAIDIFVDAAKERDAALEAEMNDIQNIPKARWSQRIRAHFAQLSARRDEIQRLMNTLGQKIEGVPQEEKPEE